jgi:Fe-S oxidoreductase
MEKYLIFKSVFMVVVLTGAFGLFFRKVLKLYHIMMAVEGKASVVPGMMGRRIKAVFTDVFGQKNVRRKFGPGIAHSMIFYGFIAIQPHSLELMIKGIFPSFEPGNFIPGIYSLYLFTADILAAFVLAGFAYALYRRLVIKPSYLTMGKDANLIILFTCVIIISFHFINAFQSVMPEEHGGFSYASVFPVSGMIADIFGLHNLSRNSLVLGYEIFYFIHIGTILGFLIHIPGSKHLHLLAAVPNVFFKRMDVEKAIAKTDIEDEDAETFGLGKVNEFSWHNVLNLYACTECGRCEELCPAAATGKPLSPKKLIHDLKTDLLGHSRVLLEGLKDKIQPIVRQESGITDDVLWACTSCRACENICPVCNEHLDFIFEMRKHQVLMEASFPSEMQETFNNLENQSNPWGFASDSRTKWCKDLDIPIMAEKRQAHVLWFVGCAGAFDDRGIKISRAIANILKKADIDFAILGTEEGCTGDAARRAGNEYLAQMMIQQNVETFARYSFDMILTGCPHCYNALKNEYPDFGADYKVVHTVRFFEELMAKGRLTISGKDFGKVTFHDSCYLGRWNNIYDEPRNILAQAVKGPMVEMEKTGEKAMCCGAGGARMFMEETMGTRINNERAEQAIRTGADTIVLSCPFCFTMLNDGIAESGRDIRIKDIAQIIDDVSG